MQTSRTDKNEFISQCRLIYKTNKSCLTVLNEFVENYESEHSLRWYTRDSFIYRLLNKALRIQNIDLLFLFCFYIRDIEKQLHENQYPSSVHVYRGQSMSTEELNVLKDSKHKLISMNSFLSTSLNPNVALMFLDSPGIDKTLERVLFEIDADPKKIGVKPFADISKFSYFNEEDEILMMLGSVFHLNEIYLDDNQIWHIQMTLCSDNEGDLKKVCDHMKKQYGSMNHKLLLFATVLIDMSNFDDAEKYLCRLLKQLPSNHKDIPKCYHALGKVSCEKGNYDLSLYYFSKAFEVIEKFKLNDYRIGYIYNGIGEVYQNKGDLKQAMESYQKALTIFKQTFTEADESIAWCYNNIGIIYQQEKDYSKALYYLEKSLTIKGNKLPVEHPCLGNTYNNLGNVYYYLEKYDEALEKYESSYKIFQKSLKPRHPSIARALKNIGVAHEAKKEFKDAKKYYEKALDIWERILSSTHPDLIEIKKDIARVSS
jgi:tetratricopeptide (TPR) repeat protein